MKKAPIMQILGKGIPGSRNSFAKHLKWDWDQLVTEIERSDLWESSEQGVLRSGLSRCQIIMDHYKEFVFCSKWIWTVWIWHDLCFKRLTLGCFMDWHGVGARVETVRSLRRLVQLSRWVTERWKKWINSGYIMNEVCQTLLMWMREIRERKMKSSY